MSLPLFGRQLAAITVAIGICFKPETERPDHWNGTTERNHHKKVQQNTRTIEQLEPPKLLQRNHRNGTTSTIGIETTKTTGMTATTEITEMKPKLKLSELWAE